MKWLKPIEEKKKVIEAAIAGWELEKANGSKAQKSFERINLMMRGLVNEVGTAIRQHKGYIYIPDLRKN